MIRFVSNKDDLNESVQQPLQILRKWNDFAGTTRNFMESSKTINIAVILSRYPGFVCKNDEDSSFFSLLTALFSASLKKGSVSQGKRKRPKKSSIGTYVKGIKQDMEQLEAEHEKILGMVLCISLHTITVLVK